MTATLFAAMVVRGAVRLESTVGHLLGAEAGAAAGVSLLELATHTSGLPRLAPNAITLPFWPRDPYRFYGRDQLVTALSRVELKDRGISSYSNLGFDVLACCLSAAAQKEFNALLRDEVFVPAGMLTARCQPCSRKDLVRGRGPILLGGRRWHQRLAGAGGVDCSIHDIAKWLDINVAPGQSALEEAIHLCQRPHASTRHGQVGLAWQLSEGVIWHNGATGAFQSVVGFIPHVGGVATLSNLGPFPDVQHDKWAIAWLKQEVGAKDGV